MSYSDAISTWRSHKVKYSKNVLRVVQGNGFGQFVKENNIKEEGIEAIAIIRESGFQNGRDRITAVVSVLLKEAVLSLLGVEQRAFTVDVSYARLLSLIENKGIGSRADIRNRLSEEVKEQHY
jgi:hypothetical protein